MKSLLEQLHRIENLLIDRTMQVAEGSIALADRHHVAVTFQAAFLDSIVELDRLAYEIGHAIRQKAVLHADQRVTPVSGVHPPSPPMEHPTYDAGPPQSHPTPADVNKAQSKK
jgi:hypothetical protein